ncbi:MAG: hypothetical protein R3F14_26855 [Polyangiaceae bacterium]
MSATTPPIASIATAPTRLGQRLRGGAATGTAADAASACAPVWSPGAPPACGVYTPGAMLCTPAPADAGPPGAPCAAAEYAPLPSTCPAAACAPLCAPCAAAYGPLW